MGETLTREDVEWCRKVLTALAEDAVIRPGESFGLKQAAISWTSKRVDSLCDMALSWLNVQPRPLSEIADPVVIVQYTTERVYVLHKYPDGCWKTHALGFDWLPSTLAIPLSSLPEPK